MDALDQRAPLAAPAPGVAREIAPAPDAGVVP
jgi:hypothetical protein